MPCRLGLAPPSPPRELPNDPGPAVAVGLFGLLIGSFLTSSRTGCRSACRSSRRPRPAGAGHAHRRPGQRAAAVLGAAARRLRRCLAPISVRYPIVEAATVVFAVAACCLPAEAHDRGGPAARDRGRPRAHGLPLPRRDLRGARGHRPRRPPPARPSCCPSYRGRRRAAVAVDLLRGDVGACRSSSSGEPARSSSTWLSRSRSRAGWASAT